MKRKILSVFVMFTLLGGMLYNVYAATVDELQQQKDELEEQTDQQKEQLNTETEQLKAQQEEVQENLSEAMQEIANLDTQIETNESEIQSLETQIDELQASIDQKEVEIQEKQEEYDENEALLSERLVVMYEKGETSFLDLLFSSEGLVDFLSNYYSLSQLAECDMELLESINTEKQEIESAKAELENQKTQITSLKAEKQTKTITLQQQKEEREQKAQNLSEEDKQLEAEIKANNDRIEQMENDAQKQLEALEEQIKKAQQSNSSNNSGSNSGSSNGGSATNGSGLHFDGTFIWPCNNKVVTSTMKNRWGRKHKGIDIGARYENVYATASGYAYTLENPSGYGHYIVIIHGNNYISLYGHLNSFKITSGQYVTQGQVIAQSGNSGSSTAPHLHYELRRASSISQFFSVNPLDPLDYLPGGYTLAAGAAQES